MKKIVKKICDNADIISLIVSGYYLIIGGVLTAIYFLIMSVGLLVTKAIRESK